MKLWQKVLAGVGGTAAAVVGGPTLARGAGAIIGKLAGKGKKGQPGQSLASMATEVVTGGTPGGTRARGTGRRRAARRIVISENTLKGVSMILSLARGRRPSRAAFGGRRRKRSW